LQVSDASDLLTRLEQIPGHLCIFDGEVVKSFDRLYPQKTLCDLDDVRFPFGFTSGAGGEVHSSQQKGGSSGGVQEYPT